MADVRFYLDENVETAIAKQIQRHGIEVVTARSLNKLGDDDISHLKRAQDMGYVFCTYDRDFLRLVSRGMSHAGIVFGQQDETTIGEWVESLLIVHALYSAEEMENRVEFI